MGAGASASVLASTRAAAGTRSADFLARAVVIRLREVVQGPSPEPALTGDDAVRRCAEELSDVAAKARVAAALFGFEPPRERNTDPLRETMSCAGEIQVAIRPATAVPQQIARYRIDALIGQGAMGRVFRAHDPELDRTLAIKVLHAEHASDERARTRIVREARALARLSHPNVVHVYDVGEASAGFFIAMEWVPGIAMSSWLRRKARAWPETLQVFLAAGEGLVAAHGAGLVHRDFKPDNVMIGDDGRVRVLDFGLARVSTGEPGEGGQPTIRMGMLRERGASLTQTGALMGTPIYLAPEVYAGQPADAASDQFSFCVALYEALYGQRPFAGHNLETYAAEVTRGEVRPLPRGTKVPASVERILHQGLSKSPAARFSSMQGCLQALQAVVDETRPEPAKEVEWQRLPVSWLAAGAMVALIALVGGLRAWSEPDVAEDTVLAAAAEARHGEEEGASPLPTREVADGQPSEQAVSPLPAELPKSPVDPAVHPDDTGEGIATDGGDPSSPLLRPIGPIAPSADKPNKEDKATSPTVARHDWCNLHEDNYRLLSRDRRAKNRFKIDGQCFACRRESRISRTKAFSPRDCAGYQLCGAVDAAQCEDAP